MKSGFRKILLLVLAVALLPLLPLSPAAAEEDGDEQEFVSVLELPEAKKGSFAELTAAENPLVAPKDKYYKFTNGAKTASSYVNPSITVNIGTGKVHQTYYMYARVKIASPFQLRTSAVEESLAKVTTVVPGKIASRTKAVLAVNGVLESDVTASGVGARLDGPVLLQGEWKRPSDTASEQKIEKWRAEEGQDTLVIDDEGNLNIVSGDTWGDIYDQIVGMGEHAVNAFCFGPALVVDGEPVYGYYSRAISSAKLAQRMAICQTGPLEYLLITSEGPENPGSKGLKLDQFVELIASFGDVKTAYNLDGGSSAALIFRKGTEKWAKINCPRGGKTRPVRDVIYFADAWIPGGK